MNHPGNRYLVFQAYGREENLRECAFAMLSWLYQHPQGIPGFHILLYTDKKEFFKSHTAFLPIEFRQIGEADIKRWRGSIDFVHRVKIEVLRDALAHFQGAFLYADTDICFLQSIRHIFEGIEAGRRYMHVQEYRLSDEVNPVGVKFRKFLEKQGTFTWSGKTERIASETAMWNAGVLGFSNADQPLLDEVLAFTDAVYPLFHKHIVEQFAFSMVFARQGQIYASCREILHYWSLKEMRAYLASFFEYFKKRPIPEQARCSQLIQLHVPMQDRGSFYLNRSPMGKIRRLPWQPLIPDWAELERQMPE
ncbi:MAG: hypothetical protein JST27_02170 [Bacteroidetes bacterium]|nr:hypothetical protein [Bacteroidota bacterium]